MFRETAAHCGIPGEYHVISMGGNGVSAPAGRCNTVGCDAPADVMYRQLMRTVRECDALPDKVMPYPTIGYPTLECAALLDDVTHTSKYEDRVSQNFLSLQARQLTRRSPRPVTITSNFITILCVLVHPPASKSW